MLLFLLSSFPYGDSVEGAEPRCALHVVVSRGKDLGVRLSLRMLVISRRLFLGNNNKSCFLGRECTYSYK